MAISDMFHVLARRFTHILFLLPITLAGLAKEPYAWPPVSAEDLALKSNPAQAGSAAMILTKSEIGDFTRGTWETYKRIKIFTAEGRRYADIEINFSPKRHEVEAISARVIQPDGDAAEFEGPFYEKTLRVGKLRQSAKVFALPEVNEGSIIDYYYRLKIKAGSPESDSANFFTLPLQEDLYIRELQLEFRMGKSPVMPRVIPRSIPDATEPIADARGNMRATLRGLPAFEPEPLMPPADSIKMRYLITFPSLESVPRSHVLQRNVEQFIGKPGALMSIAGELTTASDPAETTLSKLYNAVQKRIRNLSYEEAYSDKERKREGMKEPKSAREVWELGYGSSFEIAGLFVAMCRAAGLTADLVLSVDREKALADNMLGIVDQVSAELAAVDLPSGTRYFDPGTRFAPFGSVDWRKTSTPAIRISSGGVRLVMTPQPAPERNRRDTDVNLTLERDGSAFVEEIRTYSGQSAVDWRNEFFDLPNATREKLLRDRLRQRLPDALVESAKWEGMDDSSESAKTTLRYKTPDLGLVQGSRLVVSPAALSDPHEWGQLRSWERTHPVLLNEAFRNTETIRITYPPGYAVEVSPPDRVFRVGIAEYASSVETSENAVVWRKITTAKAGMFAGMTDYRSFKAFLSAMDATGNASLVLRLLSNQGRRQGPQKE